MTMAEPKTIFLAPCPFCGGKADFRTLQTFSRTYVTVICTECNAECDNIEESIDYCAKQEAANKWNRREYESGIDFDRR